MYAVRGREGRKQQQKNQIELLQLFLINLQISKIVAFRECQLPTNCMASFYFTLALSSVALASALVAAVASASDSLVALSS